MLLSQLLNGVKVTKLFQTVYGKMVQTHDVEVRTVQYDSRKIGREDLFVALRGTAVDGHRYIDEAVARGARVVVMEDDSAMPDSFFMHAGVVKVVVPDSRKALAGLAANYYSHPSRQLRLVGVTGTNGKTTTTYLVKSIVEAAGESVGLVGTVGYMIGSEAIPATHTTPESLELNGLLSTMHGRKCTTVVMEVSSHALSMSRVEGLAFEVAAFTNLTQDHLDFHGSLDEYFSAKKILFDGLSPRATAVTNGDSEYGQAIIKDTPAHRVTYGTTPAAGFAIQNVELRQDGTSFTIQYDGKTQAIDSPLIGRFNVLNVAAAYAIGVALRIPEEQILQGIKAVKAIPGRFERISSPKGWTAVVDYAHTPDALENCLRAIREIMPPGGSGRVITVFGCGGNRDKGKRPLMGRAASSLSDITIVTSDNPRNEDPQTILREVHAGVVRDADCRVEADRRTAIHQALSIARPGDVVLIAGKGHENYQILGETRIHFDDREEVERFIRGAA